MITPEINISRPTFYREVIAVYFEDNMENTSYVKLLDKL